VVALKKAWVWTKTHWYIPILAIAALLFLVVCPLCMTKENRLIKMFDANKKSYEKQIEAIEKSEEEKNKRKEELYSKYIDTMKDLEKKHKVDMDSLDNEKKKKLDEMVKKHKGTPEELAKELGEMFGVDYVE
tara:strand:+ start:391 stop:786 length:396 start_codon:yes stop_codon:yes gene_type:complete